MIYAINSNLGNIADSPYAMSSPMTQHIDIGVLIQFLTLHLMK